MKTVDSQPANPFPGLRPFRSDEHHLFFGREEQTAALLQLLRTNRFLAVVGTSGSGKSSLVRAGMIAELHGGTMTRAGSTWEVMILRPGGSPVENLARAFVESDLYDREDPSTLPRLLATLNRSRFGLVEAMKQCELFEPGTNLLVVVDQFEELFRFRQQGVDSEETAAAFVNLLLTASEQAEWPIYVTITMRSDYLGDCSEIPGLAEAVNDGEYLIPRLLRDQKRDAIEKPIGVGGANISRMLVQRLLNDVGDDPDQLPVLQHALMRMWDAWSTGGDDDRPIDFADFEATGGLGAALSNHADEIYDSLPHDRHRSACEKIFKTLTEKGDDNRGIRRPTRLVQLQAIADSARDTVTTVLDAFRGSGVTFLMPGAEVRLDDRTVIDLSHESLMRGWQRLRMWVEDEAQSARIFRRLLDTARLWSDGKAGLFRDPDLQIALSWREQEAPNTDWAEQYGGHFETAIGFLETSNADAEAEQQAKEAARQRELEQARQLAEAQQLRLEQQQRAARRLRVMIAGLAAVALVAGAACVVALFANQRAITLAAAARHNEERARQNEEKANQNATRAEQSQQETASALALVASQKAQVEGSLTKAETAERLARAAEEEGRKLLYTTDMRLAPFVWRDDRSTANQLRDLLSKHIPTSISTVAKPDLRGFEWNYYQHLLEHNAAIFSGHGVSVAGAAFSSGGRLVTLDQEGQVRRWELDSQDEDTANRRDLPGGATAGLRVLSPSGRLAALASGDKIHVFDTSTGKDTFQIASGNVFYRRLIFSRDEKKLVIVDDKIRWCDASSGEVIASVVNQGLTQVASLALSADGLTLAAVGYAPGVNPGFLILRLDPTTRTVTSLAKDLKEEGEALNASALSPDGERIAVGCQLNGSLFVCDTATGRSIARFGSAHASPISAIAFSGDGTKLATADVEGTIKIWADAQKLTSKSTALWTLKGHQGTITSVNFSSDGKRLASGSADKTARVWDLENAGAAIRSLEHSRGDCWVARFSADGQLIAAADGNRVRLWDAATGRLVRDLSAGDTSRVFSVAFSPTDSNLLATGHGGQANLSYVSLWDIHTGTEIARLPGATDLPGFKVAEENGPVGALAFSPDGKYLVAGFGSKWLLSADSSPTPLKVWEVATRRLIRRLNGHTGFCVSLDFSNDGKLLASGSRDGTAIIWSARTWKSTLTLLDPDQRLSFGRAGRGMVDDVAFSPDGKILALASRGGNVQLWDVASGKLLQALKGHSNAVQAVAFSPDGRTLASGGSDQTVRLWNVATRRELMQLGQGGIELGNVTTLAFSPDGERLLTGGEHSTPAFWSAAPIVWNDPGRAALKLRLLLNSNADFPSRIRMLSENLRLHEALAKLDAKDRRVQAALAATQANWHASRHEWALAVRAFDRLAAADPSSPPDAWLRTPGLLRLATALAHQNRPAVAAKLLQGGAKRRSQDGLPTAALQVGVGIAYEEEELHSLRAAVNERLAEQPRNAGLLELRAELAGQWSDARAQLADYTAAIDALSPLKAEATAADLERLYGRRGNAHVALEQWQKAVDDYARAVVDATTDETLLSNQALALSETLLSSKRWTVMKPTEMKSALGATLALQEDGSASVSGKLLTKETYTLEFEGIPRKIRAIRLEALRDDRLPNSGPGTHWSGNFILSHLAVFRPDERGPAATKEVPLRAVFATFEERRAETSVSKKDQDAGWSVSPATGKSHSAIFAIDPYQDRVGADRLRIVLDFRHSDSTPALLGRFRFSVSSDDPKVIASEASTQLRATNLTDPWTKLAAAYRLAGDQQAIDDLVARRPQAAGGVGDLFAADSAWARAVEIYSRGRTAKTNDALLLSKRARAYEALKNWEAAAADWSRAASGNPDGPRLLAEFASRLAAGGPVPLANGQFEKSRALFEESLQADPGNDPVATELAQLLLDKLRPTKPDWVVLRPAETKTENGTSLTLQDDGSILVAETPPEVVRWQPGPTPVQALRIETSTRAVTPTNGAPLFNEYQIVAASMAASGSGAIRGRFVRLDLPGDSSRFPRHPAEPDKKVINLAELQVFQGGQNIALGKKARQSSIWSGSESRFRPGGAVDGNTVGDDDGNPYAHTAENDPWWEVDLGSEEAIERMVVWNRSDAILYSRMNHFRIRVLDRSRKVVFERVIERAPSPSREIVPPKLLAEANAALTGGNQPLIVRLPLNPHEDAPSRFRVSVADRLVDLSREEEREERAQPGWAVLKPAESKTQRGSKLTLDEDGSILVDRRPETVRWQPGPRPVQALRIETSSRAFAPTTGAPLFNEYQVVAASTAASGSGAIRGQFVRLDLPGDSSQFPRLASDLDKKAINLAELQVFQGDQNISLRKKARLSSDLGNEQVAELAVDGNTAGDQPHIAHSGFESAPWWEVDLGSEQSIDRMVVWNRPDWGLYKRMSHFRVRVLDHSRRLVFEQVVEQAPAPSAEIVPRALPAEALPAPTGENQPLILRLPSQPDNDAPARFRVSVAARLPDVDLDENREEAMKINDVATRLAVAYAMNGRNDEASQYFGRALQQADGYEARTPIVEFASRFDDVLSALIKQQPEVSQLQLAWARRLAERGKQRLAEKQAAKALTELDESRKIFTRLRAEMPWKVPTPVEMKTENGSKLELQEDGSVFVHQPAKRDTYTLVFRTELKGIKGLRLEALADSRLPNGGPGCWNDGNFVLSELSLHAASAKSHDQPRPIVLRNAWADFSQEGFNVRGTVDGKGLGWAIAPAFAKDHMAVFQVAEELGDGQTLRLTVRLNHKFHYEKHLLGRFRLSFTNDANATTLQAARIRPDLKDSEVADLCVALGKAHAQLGGSSEAAASFAEAISLAADRAGRARIIEEAVPLEGVLAKLADGAAGDGRFQAELARHFAEHGDAPRADASRTRARAALEESLAKEPESSAVVAELSDVLLLNTAAWTVLKPTALKSEGGAALTLQPDGSVLASGVNPAKDVYVVKAEFQGPIGAIRLEAIPDSSMPGAGSGRYGNGNFMLTDFRVLAGENVVTWRQASADFSQENSSGNFRIDLAIDADKSTGWAIFPEVAERHRAVFIPSRPITAASETHLTIRLAFQSKHSHHALGRFRLSVSEDAAAFERERKRFALVNVVDPWARLAAAYAVNDRDDLASRYFSRALERAHAYEARKPIVEAAARFDEVLSALIERQPEDPQLQLALARKLAERGKQRLAEKQPAQAQAALKKAREILTRLRVEPQWTVLTPVEMKTDNGSKLELQEDGSVFVHQPANNDTYSLVFQTELKGIKGLRLDALADPRLPGGGPGWAPDGGFVLNELSLAAAPANSPEQPRPLAIRNASADFNQAGYNVGKAVDGVSEPFGGWAIAPQANKDHAAVFETAEEIGNGKATRFTVRLDHLFHMEKRLLGRFRLSFTNDAATLQATRIRWDLKDSELLDLNVALAEACAQQGQTDVAVASFAEALALAKDRAGKAKVIGEAAPLAGVLEKLAERAAGDARFQAELARHFAERGNAQAADAARARACILFAEKLAQEPENSALAADLLSAYQSAGRTREAVLFLAKASAADPKDTMLSLKVAALQAWFGQEKELAATRQRILASAKGTAESITAERAAMACSILPSTDKAEIEAALALGRSAVKLGNGVEWWNLLALGMSECRGGNHAAAEKALLAAVESVKNSPLDAPGVTGASSFFRAMSLFLLGKKYEARKLAIAAAAKMKPLPADERNPLAGDETENDLIVWLAYKEAKAMIRFDPLPAAADQPKAK